MRVLPKIAPEEPFLTPEEASREIQYELKNIDVDEIARVYPFKTRPLDPALVQEIKRSIRTLGGLLQPILVVQARVKDPRFEEEQLLYVPLDGHHRLQGILELLEEDPEAEGLREVPVMEVWSATDNVQYLVQSAALLANTQRAELRPRQAWLAALRHVFRLFEAPDLESWLRWLDTLERDTAELRQELGEEGFGRLAAALAGLPPDAREGTDAASLRQYLDARGVPVPVELEFMLWTVGSPAARALGQFLKPLGLGLEEFLTGTKRFRRWPVRILEALFEGAREDELALVEKVLAAGVSPDTVLVALKQAERLALLKALLPEKQNEPPPLPRLGHLPAREAKRVLPKGLRALAQRARRLKPQDLESETGRELLAALDRAADLLEALESREVAEPQPPPPPPPAPAAADREARRAALRRQLAAELPAEIEILE